MKIWILNHYAGSLEYGMEFRHYYFARELKKAGHDVTIVAGSYSHLRRYNPEVESYLEEENGGIKFVFVKTRNYEGNGKARALSMIDFYKNSLKVLKKFDGPDVIISSSPHPFACLAAIKLAKLKKCKCISEVRDLWPEAFVYYKGISESSPLVKALELIEHKIYKRSDAMIFTKPGDTDYLKEKKWMKSTGGDVDDDKCYYINNGVDLEAFLSQMTDCKCDKIEESDKRFAVTYVGTIREVNNIDMLLDAAKALKKNKDIVFRIFGDGEELSRLEKRKEDEKLDNVEFFGRIEKQFVPYILSRSSVNILNYSPTLYNWTRGNSSNKLFEYMACAKPIISTVKMGYSPIEKYNCGIEIDCCDGEKLAGAISGLFGSGSETLENLSRNASAAAKDFDYKKLSKDLINVINKTIGAKENG